MIFSMFVKILNITLGWAGKWIPLQNTHKLRTCSGINPEEAKKQDEWVSPMSGTSGNNFKVNARITCLATRNGTELIHKVDMDATPPILNPSVVNGLHVLPSLAPGAKSRKSTCVYDIMFEVISFPRWLFV